MANSRLKNALEVGLDLEISEAGMRWIKRNDPDLYQQIKRYKRRR